MITLKVVEMLFGSHLYHLDTPNSDEDYKSIYLPTAEQMILNSYPKTINTSTGPKDSKNSAGDEDNEVIALPYFIKKACVGETFALDMLHCTSPLVSTSMWDHLRENRQKFYSKDMKAYVGYVRKQAAKYGLKGSRLADIRAAMNSLEPFVKAGVERIDYIKDDLHVGEYASWVNYKGKGAGTVEQTFYEVNAKKYQSTNSAEYVYTQLEAMWDSYGHRAKQAEANEGIDWKAISHALRAGYQARDIYKDGDFEYPLKETEFILQVKTGMLNYKKEVAPRLEALVAEVDKLAESSKLPSKVNTSYWDEFILDIYL